MEQKRSRIREPFSALSHLAGAILSAIGLVVLLVLSHGRPRYTIGFSVYGASLILLYTASTLYHYLHASPKQIDYLKRFDYIAIFLLIAGTYAPLCLVSIQGAWGWGLLGTVYGIAAIGVAIILFWKNAPHWIRVALYIIMGWICVVAWPHIRSALPTAPLIWLIAGGVIYTLGTVVYATERPRLWPGKFGPHDLWHLFVLGGSACHFIVMLYAVSL